MTLRLRAVEGTVSDEDREWQERARRLPLDALYDIRAVATRWATTIGSLTGLLSLVALVAGPRSVDKLPLGWRLAAGVSLLVAIVAAGLATWCAATAAQGSVVGTLTTYERVRDEFRRQERAATTLLKRAKILVVAAMGALTTAVALAWFVPQGPVRYVVITRGAHVSCVPLDGSLTLSLTIDAAATVTVAAHCPN